MGGYCRHRTNGKKGIVLGILKKGITTVKVQWEPDGDISDVSLNYLEFIEPIPFNPNKLTMLSWQMLGHISRVSGITNEVSFPTYKLTLEEENLLNSGSKSGTEKRRHSWFSSNTWRCNSDSQVNTQSSESKTSTTRTMETLTNEMVSNIMCEVKRVNFEKITGTQSDTTLKEGNSKETDAFEFKILESKLLNIELECLRLAVLQFSALKSLSVILTSNKYIEFFLVSNNYQIEKTLEVDYVESAKFRDNVKNIMEKLVNKSTNQYKVKHIVSVAELERAGSILHFNYLKSISDDVVDGKEKLERIDLLNSTKQINKDTGGNSICNSFSRPLSSLRISYDTFPPRSIYSDPATPQGIINKISDILSSRQLCCYFRFKK